MGDIAHYQLYLKKAALSVVLTTPMWTAIESVNFTDFVQREAIAIS